MKPTTIPSLKDQGFYFTPAWRRARVLALNRDLGVCQACLRSGRISTATEVHHIKPLESFPSLALEISNLESLCRQCHEETKTRRAKPEPTYRARVIKV